MRGGGAVKKTFEKTKTFKLVLEKSMRAPI